MTTLFSQLKTELITLAQNSNNNPARFFKQGPGEYAEHDKFLGIKIPDVRKLAKSFKDINKEDVLVLLKSPYNEYRLLALFFIIDRYQKGSADIKIEMYQIYVENINFVNNWNLVDSSAHFILGAHVYHGLIEKDILLTLLDSEILWHRRIAIIASWYHIRQNNFDTTLDFAKKLLSDKHDLIHKAVGWMLREIGKRDKIILKDFLDQYAQNMPRVMLRYAIEHFDDVEYQVYLKK
jgi:3-methyladenine DNA glycosylase AlkD